MRLKWKREETMLQWNECKRDERSKCWKGFTNLTDRYEISSSDYHNKIQTTALLGIIMPKWAIDNRHTILKSIVLKIYFVIIILVSGGSIFHAYYRNNIIICMSFGPPHRGDWCNRRRWLYKNNTFEGRP